MEGSNSSTLLFNAIGWDQMMETGVRHPEIGTHEFAGAVHNLAVNNPFHMAPVSAPNH